MPLPQKRRHQETMDRTSPFLPMFETFRAELDEHHDRRERIIKASRDITAASKKIIFSLQRARALAKPLPPFITKANEPYWNTIRTQYAAISSDLQGINRYRYGRNITGGNQEFMESLSFQHYLETQSLISYEEASKRLAELGGEGGPITLTHEDYLLGIFDMVGELMRFAITNMATSGKLPSGQENLKSQHSDEADKMEIDNSSDAPMRTILTDLQALRIQLESFEAGHGGNFSRDVSKKMDVMRECVEKVEKSSYGLIVRGRERPKGWVPDIGAERPRGNDFDGD